MTSGPDFSEPTKQTFAKRAGQVCSNARCRKPTSGPHSDESKAVNLGEAAQIRAARPGGARYDANMTDQERAAISNGIWLCKKCARKIDLDETKYPVALFTNLIQLCGDCQGEALYGLTLILCSATHTHSQSTLTPQHH